MARIEVGSVLALVEGEPTIVRVDRREVALIRWRDEVFAVRNVCAHQTQSFRCGRVEKDVLGSGVPDEPLVLDDVPVLTCPWHAWKYSLLTGVSSADPTKRVRTYEVTVDGDRIFIDMSKKRVGAA